MKQKGDFRDCEYGEWMLSREKKRIAELHQRIIFQEFLKNFHSLMNKNKEPIRKYMNVNFYVCFSEF